MGHKYCMTGINQ